MRYWTKLSSLQDPGSAGIWSRAAMHTSGQRPVIAGKTSEPCFGGGVLATLGRPRHAIARLPCPESQRFANRWKDGH